MNGRIPYMRELEQRRNPIRLLSLRLFTVGLLIILFALVKGVWEIYQKERETYEGRARAERELSDLAERESQLHGEIARLRSPAGVEEALRQQFDMAKEGEGVIVIVDRAPQDEEKAEPMDMRTVSTWKRLIPLAPWKLFGQ